MRQWTVWKKTFTKGTVLGSHEYHRYLISLKCRTNHKSNKKLEMDKKVVNFLSVWC